VPALYGQASAILKYAKQNYEQLFKYIEMQAKGLSLAEAFLRINPDYL
jgi:isopentenyl-diphosphate delta-isomerase